MKVVWRQQGADWTVVDGHSYRNEAHLQEFLAENPSLIPFDDVGDDILAPRVMLSELGLPGSGSTDIVGIDEAGGITIIECKLAANPEIKRKVIGQVLEYAAYLWRQPYSFLDEAAKDRLESPLVDAVRDSLATETHKVFSDGVFIDRVGQTLVSGDFRLIVAVDRMNEELRQIIEYLSEGPSRLRLCALEISYFKSAESEVLVPQLHGFRSTKSQSPGTAGSQWSPDRFFRDARERRLSESLIAKLEDLLHFAEREATRVYWGTGKDTGSFTFHAIVDSVIYSLFSVYSDGSMVFNFGWLKDKLPPNTLGIYRDALHRLAGFRDLNVRDDFNSWPSVRIDDALASTDAMAKFEETVTSFRDRLSEDA